MEQELNRVVFVTGNVPHLIFSSSSLHRLVNSKKSQLFFLLIWKSKDKILIVKYLFFFFISSKVPELQGSPEDIVREKVKIAAQQVYTWKIEQNSYLAI